MPIYEFYCADCHRLFRFLSRRINTRKKPDCPRCGRTHLERQASAFAITRRTEGPGGESMPEMDEGRLEAAMEAMARGTEGVSEDDPKAMGHLMREFYRNSGLEIGDGMQEALRRMESGEDPDSIEADLGDHLDQEDPLTQGLKRLRRRARPPAVDTGVYEL